MRIIKNNSILRKLYDDVSLYSFASIRQKLNVYNRINRHKNNKLFREVINKKIVQGKPLVSIIIPFYNRHETVLETLESLETQTFANFEIIIVNDGSDEMKSKKILDSLKMHKLQPAIYHQKNKGVASARNLGISKAKGRYIVCLDPDDILHNSYIEKCATVLEAAPSFSFVTTGMEIFGERSSKYIPQDFDPWKLYSINTLTTATMFKKAAWASVGGYKSGIGYEDWEFWLSLAENGYRGHVIKEVLFRYRASKQSRYIKDSAQHRKNVKKIQKLHPKYLKIIRSQYKNKSIVLRSTPDTELINMYTQYNRNKNHVRKV